MALSYRDLWKSEEIFLEQRKLGTNQRDAGLAGMTLQGTVILTSSSPLVAGCRYGLVEDTLSNPCSHDADDLLGKGCCPA